MLEIEANNPNQPCSSFGIHEELPVLKELYDDGKLVFIANAGLLAKPVTTRNYTEGTPVQLFSHNGMQLETKKDDIADEYSGTGVGGRLVDVLRQAGIPADAFSIQGQQSESVRLLLFPYFRLSTEPSHVFALQFCFRGNEAGHLHTS